MAISKSLRKAIFLRDYGECSYCFMKLDFMNFHIDHVKPKSRGGSDDPTNLAASCPECNLIKGTMSEEELEEMMYDTSGDPDTENPYLNGYHDSLQEIACEGDEGQDEKQFV